MLGATDSLGVAFSINFSGASTAGLLTNGRITTAGSFIQGGGAASFAPSGANKVRLTGASAVTQNVQFGNAVNSFFHRLEVPGNGQNVVLQTNALVNDSLIMLGGAGASNLTGAGTTQRLRVNGPIRVTQQTGSPLLAPPVLEVANTWNVDSIFAAGRGVSPDTFVVLPGVTNLADGTPMRFKSVRVSSNAVTTYSTGGLNDSLVGRLVIDGTSTFSLTGGTLTALDLITAGSGVLRMQTAGTTLIVADSAIFGGGSTATQLTQGTLQVRGNFVQQGGATNAYAPSTAHVTLFGSPVGAVTNSTIFFANPAASFFHNLSASKSTSPTRGTVTLLSDARANGTCTIANSTDLRGPGQRLNCIGVFTHTAATTSPTTNNLLALEFNATPNINTGVTADTIVFNSAIVTVPIAGITYNNVRISTSGTINIGAATLAGDLDIAAGTLSFAGAGVTLQVNKLRTRGTGVLAMPIGAGAQNLLVIDSAVFAGATSSPQSGNLRLRGTFTASGAASFQPVAGHTTVFEGNIAGGAGQRVNFASPGIAAGNSWFGSLFLGRSSGPTGIALTSDAFVIGTLQDTSVTVTDSITGNFVMTAANLQTGSQFVVNTARLVLNNYTTFNTTGLTFRAQPSTSVFLTLNRAAAGTTTVSNVHFAVTPTGAGRYFAMNMTAAATYQMNFQSPVTPATGAAISGLYTRTGAVLPTVTWAGATNP